MGHRNYNNRASKCVLMNNQHLLILHQIGCSWDMLGTVEVFGSHERVEQYEKGNDNTQWFLRSSSMSSQGVHSSSHRHHWQCIPKLSIYQKLIPRNSCLSVYFKIEENTKRLATKLKISHFLSSCLLVWGGDVLIYVNTVEQRNNLFK